MSKKIPKLNTNLDKLVAKLERKGGKKKRTIKEDFKEKILTDERFKGLFTKDFEIEDN